MSRTDQRLPLTRALIFPAHSREAVRLRAACREACGGLEQLRRGLADDLAPLLTEEIRCLQAQVRVFTRRMLGQNDP